MKRLIILDIDNTLFDSGTYRKKFFQKIGEILENEGIENAAAVADHVYDTWRGKLGLFSPETFINKLLKETGVDKKAKEQMLEVIFSKKMLSNNIYEEVQDALKKLSLLGKLGIFSQGEKDIQKAKIQEIEYFFHTDHVHIVLSKQEAIQDVFSQYKDYNVFLIDDSLPILAEVKKIYTNVRTIWMKRGRYAEKQEPIKGFLPDATVRNLKEAEKIIKEKK